jgi:hypothetical protein
MQINFALRWLQRMTVYHLFKRLYCRAYSLVIDCLHIVVHYLRIFKAWYLVLQVMLHVIDWLLLSLCMFVLWPEHCIFVGCLLLLRGLLSCEFALHYLVAVVVVQSLLHLESLLIHERCSSFTPSNFTFQGSLMRFYVGRNICLIRGMQHGMLCHGVEKAPIQQVIAVLLQWILAAVNLKVKLRFNVHFCFRFYLLYSKMINLDW